MIVADTSVWIEFFRKRSPIFAQLRKLLEAGEVFVVECVFGELLQGAKNERERKIINAYWQALPKIADEGLWIEAGEYSSKHSLMHRGVGLIDCVIFLAANKAKAKLWTLDQKLLALVRHSDRFSP
jgi:predicted nucleic acid-binding protein